MPQDSYHGGRSRQAPGNQSREVMISKALSRVLRHAAVQEGIPIDSYGYVRMDHLMNWQRLKSMQPRPTMQDIIGVVNDNEKQRFGMKYDPQAKEPLQEPEEAADVNGEDATEGPAAQSEMQRSMSIFESGKDVELKHFFIRANQGHSMKGVEAGNLLSAITLDDEKSIPQTVVHGTFYGAWESILKDAGLRSMRRNHMHFSTGPPLDEVIKQQEHNDQSQGRGLLQKLMEQNKVVSGMRPDAQILVYVDILKALKEGGMKWWKSENGVILTDGVDGVVATKYWEAVVEVKEGLGVLWEKDNGVVQDLPAHLNGRPMPFGKSRGGGSAGGRGGGKVGKPKLKMERDGLGDV